MSIGQSIIGGRRGALNLGNIKHEAVLNTLNELNLVETNLERGNQLIAALEAIGAGELLFHLAKRSFDPEKAGSSYWFCLLLFRLAASGSPSQDALTGTIRFFDKYGAKALKEEKSLAKPQTISASFKNLVSQEECAPLVEKGLYKVLSSKHSEAWAPGVRYSGMILEGDPLSQLLVWSGRSGMKVIRQLISSRKIAEKPLLFALARMDESLWVTGDGRALWEIFCIGDLARNARKKDPVSLACFVHFESLRMQQELAVYLQPNHDAPPRWDALQIAALVPYRVEEDLRAVPFGYEETEPLQCALIKLASTDLEQNDHVLEAKAVLETRSQKLFNAKVDLARRWALNPGRVDLIEEGF